MVREALLEFGQVGRVAEEHEALVENVFQGHEPGPAPDQDQDVGNRHREQKVGLGSARVWDAIM